MKIYRITLNNGAIGYMKPESFSSWVLEKIPANYCSDKPSRKELLQIAGVIKVDIIIINTNSSL